MGVKYFKGTNLYIPDPYRWLDPLIIAGLVVAAVTILAATGYHVLHP
jgi:hypothetical protein